jgi:hypothetical protein
MEIEAPPNLDNKDEAQAWLEKLWRGILLLQMVTNMNRLR